MLVPDPVVLAFGAALVAGLAWAVRSDVMRRTIPNRLCLALAVAGLGYALVGGQPGSPWVAVALAAAVLLGGMVCFAFGWFGGGDVKLAAALTLWAGPAVAMEFLFVAALAGAGLAVATLLLRAFPVPYVSTSALVVDPRPERGTPAAEGMPYGLAIAAGGVFILYRMLAG
jgi:prepilin peptidase CpaA